MELEDDLFIVLDGSDICPKCGKQGGSIRPRSTSALFAKIGADKPENGRGFFDFFALFFRISVGSD